MATSTHPDLSRQRSRVIAWMIAAAVPVAVLTSETAPRSWQFPLLYVVTAFLLGAFVRPKNPQLLRAAHIVVLSGSAPVMVRVFFGSELTWPTLVHFVAVLVISIGVGYWLADRIRPGSGVAMAG